MSCKCSLPEIYSEEGIEIVAFCTKCRSSYILIKDKWKRIVTSTVFIDTPDHVREM